MGEVQTVYPLIHNKVTTPHYVTPLLRRQRLLDWLTEHQDCRAVVVAADAGYGKTTLLWQWEQEVSFPCYWYKLDRQDRDWSLQVSYLIASIAQRNPGFGHKAHSMLLQMGEPGTSRPGVVAFLLAEMHERLTEPCTFIIDDWQFVASQTEVRGLWNQILRDAPPTCRFIFLARGRPHLQFARLRLHGGFAEIRSGDLRFSPSEADQLFREVYGDPLDPMDLVALDRRTEGWAASLQLVELSLRDKKTPESRRDFIDSIISSSESELFAFLAQEVLEQQSQEDRTFLLNTSILEQITPELAERLAGALNGEAFLRDFEQRGLFTFRLDDRKHRYRYHGLFRDFLGKCLLLERSHAEIVGLHIHAASYFETDSQWPEAIHHYLEAGLQRQAARLIGRYGEDIVAEGRLGRVDEWLGKLPAKVIREHARLSLLHGEILGIRGEWSAADQTLMRSLAYFEKKGDAYLTALALLKLSSVKSAEGDVQAAADYAERGVKTAPAGAGALRLRLRGNLVTSVTWAEGPLHKVADECMRIEAEARQLGLDHYASIASHNLGMVQRQMGRLHESEQSLERAALFWSQSGTSPFGDNSELVQTLLIVGKLGAARSWARLGESATHPWQRPHAEARLASAMCDAAAGNFGDASIQLQQLLPMHFLGATRDIVVGVLTDIAYLTRDASTLESLRRLDPDPRDPRLAGFLAPVRALWAHGTAGSCQGDCQSASRVANGLRNAGARFSAAQVSVRLAPLLMDHGEGTDSAIDAASEVIRSGSGLVHRYWLREYRRHAKPLAQSAAGRELLCMLLGADPEGWRDAVAAEVRGMPADDRGPVLEALRRFSGPQTVALLAPGNDPDILEARRRINLDRAPRLHALTLGPLAFRNGNSQVDISKRRTRLLLGLLLAHLGASVSRDAAMDALWPESDGEAANNSLNQTIFQLRKSIDPLHGEAERPAYLVSSAEGLALEPRLIRTDLEDLRKAAALLQEGQGAHRNRMLAERSVRLIRGPFLADMQYESWITGRQAAVHAEVRSLMLSIARGLHGEDADLSIQAAGALLLLDPWDETAHLLLATRLMASGRRQASRELLLRYEALIQSEMDEEPSAELRKALTDMGVARKVLLDSPRRAVDFRH